jgi:hypothetical protein
MSAPDLDLSVSPAGYDPDRAARLLRDHRDAEPDDRPDTESDYPPLDEPPEGENWLNDSDLAAAGPITPATADRPVTEPLSESVEDDPPIVARVWPTLDPAALQGAAGELVTMIEPTTEADPAAVLVTLLAAFGSWVGPGPHLVVANRKHPAVLWPLIVGSTGDGAKGTSWDLVERIFAEADSDFMAIRRTSGLSTGEGLIEQVRDGFGDDPDAKDFDEGEPDKRLLVIETEYAAVLSRMARQGNTLGQLLRDAWDGTPLRTLTRNTSRLRADEYHITVVGHITPAELVARLHSADLAGGSINRLLMVLSKRSKCLPEGGNLPAHVLQDAVDRLTAAKDKAQTLRECSRTAVAEARWGELYGELVRNRGDGREAQATARAVPQVLRLALLYALLDASSEVDVEHIEAAVALWRYAEASARYIFGDPARPDGVERAKLLEFISAAGSAGVSREQIRSKLFNRNKNKAYIDPLIRELIESGAVTQHSRPSAGRPATIFVARDNAITRFAP